jgi:hypothetical protein
MKYSTPDDEEENLGPSKSALKREMTALQKLGVALVALSRDQLKKVDMPERLRDAILSLGRTTPRPEVLAGSDRQDGRLERNRQGLHCLCQCNGRSPAAGHRGWPGCAASRVNTSPDLPDTLRRKLASAPST